MKFSSSCGYGGAGARLKTGVMLNSTHPKVAAQQDPTLVALRCKAPPCPCSEALHYCLGYVCTCIVEVRVHACRFFFFIAWRVNVAFGSIRGVRISTILIETVYVK